MKSLLVKCETVIKYLYPGPTIYSRFAGLLFKDAMLIIEAPPVARGP